MIVVVEPSFETLIRGAGWAALRSKYPRSAVRSRSVGSRFAPPVSGFGFFFAILGRPGPRETVRKARTWARPRARCADRELPYVGLFCKRRYNI